VAHFIEVKGGLIVRSHEYNHMETGQTVPSHNATSDADGSSAETTAKQWVEAFNRASSVDDYIAVFADDLDWWHMTDWWRGSEARFPKGNAGGLADYRQALEFDAATLTGRRMEPYLVIADGPGAAMRYRWYAKAPSGDRIAWDRVAVITVDGDRITRLHEYGGPLAAS
jgi:ketosteroid isomerase-like protein